jgi:hypothetical protein
MDVRLMLYLFGSDIWMGILGRFGTGMTILSLDEQILDKSDRSGNGIGRSLEGLIVDDGPEDSC